MTSLFCLALKPEKQSIEQSQLLNNVPVALGEPTIEITVTAHW
jgi:hypothetical protein